jgi:hypothetical protein
MRAEYAEHLERTLRAFVGLVGKVEEVKALLEEVDKGYGKIFEPELGEARGCMEEAKVLMKGEEVGNRWTGGGLKDGR